MQEDEKKVSQPERAQGETEQKREQRDVKSRTKRAIIGCACVIGAALFFFVGWLGSYYSLDARSRSLLWAIETVKNEYYTEVDEDALYDRIFSSLSPDSYSYYMTAEEYAAVESAHEGVNGGVGISVASASEGAPRLYSVVENSPACLAGLKKGMYVYAYGAQEHDMTQAEGSAALYAFVSSCSGAFVLSCGFEEDGSDAALYSLEKATYLAAYCVYRDSGATFVFRGGQALTLTEDAAGGLSGLDDETAYLRIDSFNGNVREEVAACLALMRERGRKHLVLDLRGNGGGYLSDLLSIASHLMRDAGENAVVAQARYRNGSVTRYVASKSDFSAYFREDSRVSVLADENTASASECLIGALVDHGTIGYGDIWLRAGSGRTYGKGVMQSTYRDAQGNAMRLTTAEVLWPNGKSINGTGVTLSDGARAADAPLLSGKEDVFLQTVLSAVCP